MAETKRLRFDEQMLNRLIFTLSRSVGAVGSATQALLNGAVEDPTFRSELLVGMETQVYELERLLENIVQLRAWQRRALRLRRRPVAVHEWLPRLINRWGHAAAAEKVCLEFHVPSNLQPLDADPDRLNLVLDNMLAQVLRCVSAQDHVILGAGNEADRARITLEVPCMSLQEILEPPRNVLYKRFSKELGIEIPIARTLAQTHGGGLEMEQSGPKTCSLILLWPTVGNDPASP